MVLRDGPVIRSEFPRAGSLSGIQKRQEFIHDFLTIAPDTRLLWLPVGSETTTSTDRSRNARVITYDATVAGRYSTLGSGLSVSFNGTDQEADTPDVAALSFGDASVDEPFSIVAWVNQTATTGIKEILTKYDITTGLTKREWRFFLDAAEKLNLVLYDESVPANIGRLYNTALATGSVLFVAGTYSGSILSSGVKLYSAAALIDDTDVASGAYVAMENTASLVRLGFSQGAAAGVNFFPGSMACVALVAGALDADELHALKLLGNGYFQLTL